MLNIHPLLRNTLTGKKTPLVLFELFANFGIAIVVDMKRRSKHRPQVYKSYTYMQQIEEHDLFKATV